MPGRPRLYLDAAERQREYRARQKEQQERQERRRREEHAALCALHHALKQAAAAGDPLAQRVLREGLYATCEQLAAHFEEVAATRSGGALVTSAAAPAAPQADRHRRGS